MKRLSRFSFAPFVALVALSGTPRHAQADEAADPLARAMHDELARSMADLRLPDTPKPYYVAYRVDDVTDVTVSATFGALVQKVAGRMRHVRVDARVGDYDHDSSNFAGWRDVGGIEGLPLEDDYDVLRHDLWVATDRAYKQAAATFAKKQAARATEADAHDHVADFSHEGPAHVAARHAVPAVDVEQAATLVRELSALARKDRELQASEVTLHAATGRQTFLSSEGTSTDEDASLVQLSAVLKTQAADGMPLRRVVSFSARSLGGLPARDVLERAIANAASDLAAERAAPEAEDYVGPVLFEPHAAAQLVSDLLAPQLGGTPPPKGSAALRAVAGSESELVSKIDQRVMAQGLWVEDDPTLEQYRGLPLVGDYAADDEGMAGQKVVVIENGIFKRFLMSRAPRKGFDHSNGHAHAPMFGAGTKANISNLIVSTKHGATSAELRRALLAAAKADGRTYAVIVRELDDAVGAGDFMSLMLRRSRGGGAVSSPIAVVKVTLDGKEHPMRGATFGALPLRTFEDVSLVGADVAVASRAGVTGTASVVSPALLIKHVEIRKPTGPQREPPAIGRP